MTKTEPRLHANNEFIGACIEIDALLAQLTTLRANHFGVDAEAQRQWGEVNSVRFVAQKLNEALAHYGKGTEA
jgi:hypothetical protein